MNAFDEILRDTLQKDAIKVKAESSIFNKLMHHFYRQTIHSSVVKNSIVQPIYSLFTSKLGAIKIGIAAMVILGFLNINQMHESKHNSLHCDSTYVDHKIDSLHKNVYYTDSLSR